MSELEQLKADYEAIKDTALNDYKRFLRFQSISSEPAFKEQVTECADWVVKFLQECGFEVEVWRSSKDPSRHPVIFASHMKAGATQPVLLIYNHYDVQPVDPLELWESPPFEPSIKNNQIYARGAQDNKGQCFYVLLALKALLKKNGALPINVKLCIEGEEETGSFALAQLLAEKKEMLRADYIAVVDLGMPNSHTPAITLGIRGIVTMDLMLEGSTSDLHSGSHGGLAYNPIHALVKLLSMARDAEGKIAIPGFYDQVKPLQESEKAKINMQFDAQQYEKAFGQPATGGEHQLPHLERNWLRPTLEVNGIHGGYTGTGFKTVIPAKAFAKISCRLVPNQEPEQVGKLVADFFEKNAPKGCKVTVHLHEGGGKPGRANSDSPIVKAYAQASQEVFGCPCEYIYSGATIPIATALAETSESDLLLVGLGLAEDAIHAPNEHFGLDRIQKGFLIISRMLQLLKK